MTLRASVAQIGSVPFDAAKTTDKVVDWINKAADDGSELVLFPEAMISCYPKGYDFGCMIGVRTPDGREEFARYFNSAITVPGAETDRIAEAAAARGIQVVIGVIERDGGTIYCTVLFFTPEGGLVGKHRKLMPTASERLVWGYGDGSTLPVFDTSVGKIGAVICWENYMPMLRMAMYAKGVAVYCAPTADDRETWLPTMRHIAREGRCYVLSSCQVLRPEDFQEADRPDMIPTAEGFLMTGGSAIIDPLGEVVAGPVFGEETLLSFDLDADVIAGAKLDFDVAGHYARPDVFTLTVDEREKTPVRSVTS
ncbi:MAG: carbon-nitrogen hydrolase family protein [Rhodovulum sp.]|nr:carbon-nitrogen hydrolase family protein [Rhodovulum sp.]